MSNQEEQVMAVPRALVDKLELHQGFNAMRAVVFKGLIKEENFRFIPRSEAETDETHLQLIPYVIVVKRHSVLTYQRTKLSGEQRLIGKHSIGFGGHINSDDVTFQRGLIREIFEEELKGLNVVEDCPSFRGLILDDSSAVGRVHLGIVYVIAIGDDHKQITSDDPNIRLLDFVSLDRLYSMITYPEIYPFEEWSKTLLSSSDAPSW